MRVTLRVCLLIGIALLVVACGTVAEPRPTFEPTPASHARLSLDEAKKPLPEDVDSEEVATEEAHEHKAEATAVPTEAPADHEHAEATEAVEPVAEATEEHTDDHEHAEATEVVEPAAATEEAEDHEHAEATAEAAQEAELESTGVVMVIDGEEYVGEAEYGETIFRSFPNPDPGPPAQPYCVSCHNPDEPIASIGPYLYGIASREGTHAEHDHGTGAELIDYLYESIVDPDAKTAPSQINTAGVEIVWTLDKMPENWESVLSDQQIADLIAYLMSLDQASE